MKTLKTLLVGVGNRGSWAVRHCRPENGYEVTGICDPNDEFREAAATNLELAAECCYTEIDVAIRGSGAECVVICAPTKFHLPYAVKGFEAGMSVLTEKGMASSWAEACEAVAQAEKHGAKFCVAQNYRYRPLERGIKSALDGELEGIDLGKVFHLDYIVHRVRPFPKTLNYPFASVWDMSCHHFDNIIFWRGFPKAMTAQAYGAPYSAYEHPNNTTAHIEMEDGTRINYFHGHDSGRNQEIINIHGSAGALTKEDHVEELIYSPRPGEHLGTRPEVTVPLPELPPSELLVVRDFYRYVTEGVEPGISHRHNIEVMAVAQMLILSVTEGRRVERGEIAVNGA